MVLSLGFPMKLMKRHGKSADSLVTFPFNHPRQHHGTISSDDSSSLGTSATVDDDSTSFHTSGSSWETARSSKRITVSFNTSLNEEYSNGVMVKSEVRELWYQPSDYQLFRSMALDASQQIIATEKRNRAPHSYQRVLERTYSVCCSHSASTEVHDDDDTNHAMEDEHATATNSMSTTYCENHTMEKSAKEAAHTSILSPEDFVHLQRWLEVGSSRIGLEKWSIRTITSSRSARRDAMLETIMSIQHEVKYERSKKPSCKNKLQCSAEPQHERSLNDDRAEFIRGTSERLSRPSCIFSLVMAQGLAAAVAKENIDNSI